jgi:MerR family transcriptional regulator, redox-sensitive transcriptional activator SoxR
MRELSVGEVAKRGGVAVSALHFYEKKGLIRSLRTTGNQRRFPADVLRRIAVIRVAQRVGIPLEVVRKAFAGLPDERTPTREEWARMSAAWREELDQRISQLVNLKDKLADCIGCGCLSMTVCALANPGDALAGEGGGPRRWVPD